jgi:hypothetical protein
MRTLLASAIFSIAMLAAPMAKAQYVQVRVAPPAPMVEVVPAAPSPRHIWVPGYHRWAGGRHVWVPGTYMLPPRPYYTHWEPHRWEFRGGYYHFRAGYWRR